MFKSLWKSLVQRIDLSRRASLQKARAARHRVRLQVTALEERALMAAGLLDTSFSTDAKQTIFFDAGGANQDHAAAVAVQPDGKIVVAGWAEGPNGDRDFAVARRNADGTVDATFGPNGSGKVRVAFDLGGNKHDEGHAVVIQPDGKIVVAGQVDRIGGDVDMGVIRLNVDGTLDDGSANDTTQGDSFGVNGKATIAFDQGGSDVDVANAVTLNGSKIIVAGFAQVGAINFDMAVAQLEADGSLDLNFNQAGLQGRQLIAFDLGGLLIDQANAVVMQGQKIIVAGLVNGANGSGDMGVARLNANGTLDNTFSPGGADGGSGRTTVAFDLGSTDSDTAAAVAIQPDGKIVLAGSAARSTAGDFDFAVARLLADGDLDTLTFGAGGKTTIPFDDGNGTDSDRAAAVALQSDGKVLVAGTVERDNGDTDFGIARLTAAGILDTTYSPGGVEGNGRALVSFNLGQANKDTATGMALTSGDRAVVVGTVQRASGTDTDLGIGQLLGDPPAAPQVTSPSTAQVVFQTSFIIQGVAEAGSLVRITRNGTEVGQQQLGAAETNYAITVPLDHGVANAFQVTATKFNSESTPTAVATITAEGIVARVVKKKKARKARVEVRGAVSGTLLRLFGPYAKVRTRLQDLNQDGVADLIIESRKNGTTGKKVRQAFSGRDLSPLSV